MKLFFLLRTILLVNLLILLISIKIYSQEVSTNSEIYNFQVGDIFQYDELFRLVWNENFNKKMLNIEILDKYYSINNDTVFYIRDISSVNYNYETDTTYGYNYYVDTIFFSNLNGLINEGNIDTTYIDSINYHGRKVNHIEDQWAGDSWEIDFVNGLGRVYKHILSSPGENEKYYILTYYKKNNEIYGNENILLYTVNTETIPFSFQIYPNPNNKNFHLKFNDNKRLKTSVQIFNLDGKEVYSKNHDFTSEAYINLTNVSKGIYFIKVQRNKNSEIKQFIIF